MNKLNAVFDIGYDKLKVFEKFREQSPDSKIATKRGIVIQNSRKDVQKVYEFLSAVKQINPKLHINYMSNFNCRDLYFKLFDENLRLPNYVRTFVYDKSLNKTITAQSVYVTTDDVAFEANVILKSCDHPDVNSKLKLDKDIVFDDCPNLNTLEYFNFSPMEETQLSISNCPNLVCVGIGGKKLYSFSLSYCESFKFTNEEFDKVHINARFTVTNNTKIEDLFSHYNLNTCSITVKDSFAIYISFTARPTFMLRDAMGRYLNMLRRVGAKGCKISVSIEGSSEHITV